jgi:hypothetical protein
MQFQACIQVKQVKVTVKLTFRLLKKTIREDVGIATTSFLTLALLDGVLKFTPGGNRPLYPLERGPGGLQSGRLALYAAAPSGIRPATYRHLSPHLVVLGDNHKLKEKEIKMILISRILKWLVNGFPPRRPGSCHVGFVADEVALEQVFSEHFGIPSQ